MYKGLIFLCLGAVFVAGCDPKGPPGEPINAQDNKGTETPVVSSTPEATSETGSTPTTTPDIAAGNKGPGHTPVTSGGSPSTSKPARPEITRPEPPKADESVAGAYEAGGTKIEIEGGCKITEDAIACWKADGSANPDLEAKVKESFENSQNYGGPSYQLRYGKKNRVIVFRTTTANSIEGRPVHVGIVQVGSDQMAGSYINLNLNDMTGHDPSQPNVRYEARSVSTEKGETTTTARLTVMESLPDRPLLDCKVGASAVIGGVTYTISSIEPYKADLNRYPGMTQMATWKITFKKSGKSERPMNVMIMGMSGKGSQISYATKAGDPVTQEEYQKAMTDAMRAGGASMNAMQQRYVQAMASPFFGDRPPTEDKAIFTIGINPKKLPKLGLTASYGKTVDLTGIPLDGR